MGYIIDGNDFAAYKVITPTRPTAALTDYPLKVGIVADSNIGGRCLSTGADVRFTLPDGTLLYSEKNDFAIAAGLANGNYWVNVPSIPSGADTPINMYYGCPTAAAQANPELTWNSDYLGVYHFNEASWDGTPDEVKDSTATAAHGVAVGGATPDTGGKIGPGCMTRDANGEYILGPTAPWPIGTDSSQVECWLRPLAGNFYACAVEWGPAAYPVGHRRLHFYNYSGPQQAFEIYGYGWGVTWSGGTAWTHCVWQFVSTRTLNWYQAGAYLSASDVVLDTIASPLFIGCAADGINTSSIRGSVCELRIRDATSSDAQIAYDYLTQNTAAGGLTWSAETVSMAYNVSVGIMMV